MQQGAVEIMHHRCLGIFVRAVGLFVSLIVEQLANIKARALLHQKPLDSLSIFLKHVKSPDKLLGTLRFERLGGFCVGGDCFWSS